MKEVNCNLCGKISYEVLLSEDYSIGLSNDSSTIYSVNTVVCRECGHIYNTPQLEKEELEKYYLHADRQNYEGGEFSLKKQELYKKDVEIISNYTSHKHSKNVLDIGCYSGLLLKMLKSDGWNVFGVEPNQQSVVIAKERFGLDIFCGMFDDFLQENRRKYDLVVLASVLEHLPDPHSMLQDVNDILEDGGCIYIRVPNSEYKFKTIGSYFSFEHLNMFSRRSINCFLNKAGFDTVYLENSASQNSHIRCLAEKNSTILFDPSSYHYDHETFIRTMKDVVDISASERSRVNNLLNKLWNPTPKRVAIFGAGTHTYLLLKYTNLSKSQIICLIDNSKKKQLEGAFGFSVISKKQVPSIDVDCIVISSKAFENEIYESIKDLEIPIVRLYNC